jgi:hypothetical protein
VALRPGLDIWAEGHIVRYNDDIGGINREGDFGILYAGVAVYDAKLKHAVAVGDAKQ